MQVDDTQETAELRVRLTKPEYRLQAWDLCGPNEVIRRKDRRSCLIADFPRRGHFKRRDA